MGTAARKGEYGDGFWSYLEYFFFFEFGYFGCVSIWWNVYCPRIYTNVKSDLVT